MIFAAGLGTRLRPLTDERPKALVEVGGIPLLEIAIRRLTGVGVREIIVNVHHFADQIVDFLQKKQNFGIHIALSDEREQLLDTGGGLKKAAWFLAGGDPFFVYNADILTNLDLRAFYSAHLCADALATVAVQHRESSRYLLFDADRRLCGWTNASTGQYRWCGEPVTDAVRYSFSGIHIISPAIFEYMPEEAVFSMIDLYLRLGNRIMAYPHDGDRWLDVGKPDALAEAMRNFPIGLD